MSYRNDGKDKNECSEKPKSPNLMENLLVLVKKLSFPNNPYYPYYPNYLCQVLSNWPVLRKLH